MWLGPHLDLQLAAELGEPGTVDVIVHGTALAKYRPSSDRDPASHLRWLSPDELGKYATEKRAFDTRARPEVANGFAAACTATGRVDPMFGGALERLFYYCRLGCLDALAFAHSCLAQGRAGKIHVIAGGEYRLTEVVGLIWWLAVLRRFTRSGSSLAFHWTSRRADAIHAEKLDQIVNLLAGAGTTQPALEGEIPDAVRDGREPVCIAWLGSVRYPRGWAEELRRFVAGSPRVLRVVEQGMSPHYERPCIELSVGTTAAVNELRELLRCAEASLARAPDQPTAGAIVPLTHVAALERFFESGVAPLVARRVAAATETIDALFGKVDLAGLVSATAPFIETVALHQWARARSALPVLLPHSWTSSHEFPAATYRASLTFIGSELITPSVHYDVNALAKEEIVPLARVQTAHAASAATVATRAPSGARAVRLFVALPFAQKWRMAAAAAADMIAARRAHIAFRRSSERAGLKVGYILNYEHYEFTAGLEFGQLFQFIAGLGSEVAGLGPASDPTLLIRRKAGWTNLRLLERHRRAWSAEAARTVVVAPDSVSLRAFGKQCTVVMYSQGTSAIPELMSFAVAMIQLDEPVPVLLDEPYVLVPEAVVPRMTVAQVMDRLSADPSWARDLGARQRAWIATQMTA